MVRPPGTSQLLQGWDGSRDDDCGVGERKEQFPQKSMCVCVLGCGDTVSRRKEGPTGKAQQGELRVGGGICMGFEGWGQLGCSGREQESHSRKNGADRPSGMSGAGGLGRVRHMESTVRGKGK